MESLDPVIFKDKIKTLEEWSDYIAIMSIIILTIGIILYYIKKKKEYGKSFSYIYFIFEEHKCSK